jgi:hypothetical protein
MTITKIPWEKNLQADALARAGSATEQEIIKMKRQVLVQPSPSIVRIQGSMQIRNLNGPRM